MTPLARMLTTLVACTAASFGREIFRFEEDFKDYFPSSDVTVVSLVTSPPSRTDCFIACADYLRCVSVFYNSQDGRCELQEGRFFQPLGGTTQAGWQHWTLEAKSSCPTERGYIYHRASGLCYRPRTDVLMRWDDATATCIEEGGHLLVVDSQEKQDVVAAQLRTLPPTNQTHGGWEGFYIDGRMNELQEWRLSTTGEIIGFSAWQASEHIGKWSDSEIYVAMVNDFNFNWFSVCPVLRPFICQVDLIPQC